MITTIESISESIGIPLHNEDLILLLGNTVQSYLKQIISCAQTLRFANRKITLTREHINNALSIFNEQILLGYNKVPVYSVQSIPADNADLYPLKDISKSMEEEANKIPPLLTNYSSPIHWVFVDDLLCSQKNTYSMKKSVSRSNHMISNSDTDIHVANDHLSGELQTFFRMNLLLLRSDTANSIDLSLSVFETDTKYQPLLPYLIQYIYGKITENLTDDSFVLQIALLTRAIIRNSSLPITFFVHSFLNISLTLLLNDLSKNIQIREIGSEILGLICNRNELCFPEIRNVTFNILSSSLFSANGTIGSKMGAILGIEKIGVDYFSRLLPHLISWVRLTFSNSNLNKVISFQTNLFYLNDIINREKFHYCNGSSQNICCNKISSIIEQILNYSY